MTKKLIYKIAALSISIIFSQSFLANENPKSPFEQYNPNLKKPSGAPQGNQPNNGTLSMESEMQVRDMIYQEFLMRENRLQKDKDAGIAPLDDNEILYLGPNESLKGTMGDSYIIFNKTTNMFRNENMSEYKKVVTSDEVENIIEKENLKEQTQGKITQ